jgi:phosphatidate cytidylyltransferase
MSNLLQRVLVGVVAIPLALGAAWLGGWVWACAVAAAALIAQYELYGLAGRAGASPILALGLPLGALAAVRALVPWAGPVLAAGIVLVVVAPLFRRSATPLMDAAVTLFGVAYPALLLGFAVDIRETGLPITIPPLGFRMVAAVMLCIWGADCLAYAAGRAAGRHPLMPRVSPNKTWEGSAGGLLGAVLIAAACKATFLPEWSWLDVAAIGAICGAASQLGDLAESLYKRSAGVKDSGTWIPGHGGALDRLDAAAVAVPLSALYLGHVAPFA